MQPLQGILQRMRDKKASSRQRERGGGDRRDCNNTICSHRRQLVGLHVSFTAPAQLSQQRNIGCRTPHHTAQRASSALDTQTEPQISQAGRRQRLVACCMARTLTSGPPTATAAASVDIAASASARSAAPAADPIMPTPAAAGAASTLLLLAAAAAAAAAAASAARYSSGCIHVASSASVTVEGWTSSCRCNL